MCRYFTILSSVLLWACIRPPQEDLTVGAGQYSQYQEDCAGTGTPAGWTAVFNNIEAVGGECHGTTAGANIISFDTIFDSTFIIWATITDKPVDNGDGLIIGGRAQDDASVGTFDGVQLRIGVSAGTDNWIAERIVNGGQTSVATLGNQEFSATDRFMLLITASGATLRWQAWYDGGSGWSYIGTTTETSNSENRGDGKPYLLHNDTEGGVDDIGFGYPSRVVLEGLRPDFSVEGDEEVWYVYQYSSEIRVAEIREAVTKERYAIR